MPPELMHRRLTLEAYEKLVEDGILTSDDRVELLDGEIVEKMPIGPRHCACVRKLHERFYEALRGTAGISVQSPIGLPPRSEPEPDVALLRPRADDYATLHPRPHEVLLVVEVADSTLRRDRAKLKIYAESDVPEVWIVDVNRDVVEVYTQPDGARYRRLQVLDRDASLTPLAFPSLSIAVVDALPTAATCPDASRASARASDRRRDS